MQMKIKIKPLTKSQILISIDRLTRFKPTEDKYLRVFKDILTGNLIYPKYKKNQLDLMDYDVLTNIVKNIFDYSFKGINVELTGDYTVNSKLLEYEKSIFKFDKNVSKLLKNKIDYKAAINLLDSKKLSLNLKWLKCLADGGEQVQNRIDFGLKFPLEKVIIVEGITEEILLPKFAKLCGLDFDKLGIHVISAGGKNQVVKLFYQYADILKIPMYVLLDSDAKQNRDEIAYKLRKNDKIHVIECGEFEDILPLNLVKRTLNRHFADYFSVNLADLRGDLSMVPTLSEIFKARGMEFKKAEFASLVGENVLSKKDVSPEVESIIMELVN